MHRHMHGAREREPGIGHGFLDFCTELGVDSFELQDFATSLRDVVQGRAGSVAGAIECHVGHTKQWFHVRAAALPLGGERRALITCRDINLTRSGSPSGFALPCPPGASATHAR